MPETANPAILACRDDEPLTRAVATRLSDFGGDRHGKPIAVDGSALRDRRRVGPVVAE